MRFQLAQAMYICGRIYLRICNSTIYVIMLLSVDFVIVRVSLTGANLKTLPRIIPLNIVLISIFLCSLLPLKSFNKV